MKWKHITTIWFIIISLIILLVCFIIKIRFSLSLRKTVELFIMMEYLFLVLLSTVFTRRILEAPRSELSLLWSYRWGYKLYGWRKVIIENCINIILLVPIAILLLRINQNRNRYRFVAMVGFAISLCIELLQFILCRGTFELDDLLHNMIGVALVIIVNATIIKIQNRRTQNEQASI